MGAIGNWTRQQPGLQRSRYREFVEAIRPSCLHLRRFLWSRGPERSLRVRRIELHKHTISLVLALIVELGPIGIANAIVSDSLSATANMLSW